MRHINKKKRTRATIAKERGLEQLALDILNKNISNIDEEASKYINPEKEVNSVEDAIKGANDIIAEIVSDDAKIRKYIRELALREGVIVTKIQMKKNQFMICIMITVSQ